MAAMGNKEALLDAAKRCLLEKGYAATSARDLSAAAGVSQAAFGDHFGGKDALLTTALIEAMREWGEGLEAMLASLNADALPPARRFATAWERAVASFADTAPLWRLQFEVLALLDRHPELRETVAAANGAARAALVDLFGPDNPRLTEAQRQRLGALYQALLGGLAAQWLVDPAAVLDHRELPALFTSLAKLSN
jgi:AcrR family transcriptional regulator